MNQHLPAGSCWIGWSIVTLLLVHALPTTQSEQSIKVTTLASVIGKDGEDITVPCSFTINPAPNLDQDYVLRWIKYPVGATFYNVYNYNGKGEFDGPVNSPAEGRYWRHNQDLHIPHLQLGDQGKLCCEIVLLPDMTATGSNCTCFYYVDFADHVWKAVDKKNTSLITNPDYYITAIPPVTLEVNISYNEIYPPCDLALYRRTTVEGNDVLTELDRKLQSQVTAVNGRYSLLMEAKQPIRCIGQQDITRLVARIENCKTNSLPHECNLPGSGLSSPPFELEKHFTVICAETCSPACQNHGTCTNNQCFCAPNYMGKHCECRVTENPCKGDCDYCMNGGTCVYANGNAVCKCTYKWTGKVCQEPRPYTTTSTIWPTTRTALETTTNPTYELDKSDNQKMNYTNWISKQMSPEEVGGAVGAALLVALLIGGLVTFGILKWVKSRISSAASSSTSDVSD